MNGFGDLPDFGSSRWLMGGGGGGGGGKSKEKSPDRDQDRDREGNEERGKDRSFWDRDDKFDIHTPIGGPIRG
jgi:hypothetical protein